MKEFLLEFFGLSCCLKSVDQVVVENNQRDEWRHDPNRQRPRRREQHSHNSSSLQRSGSSRHKSGNSIDGGNLPTKRRPSKSDSNGSTRNRNNVPRRPSIPKDRYGRDDPQAIRQSLSETMWHSHDEEDENDITLDEQIAMVRRRSLKDQQQQPQSTRENSYRRIDSQGNNSQRSKLEKFIEERDGSSPLTNDDDDVDNVTTISKASINPYRLLNISQSASPHDAYRGYKRKMKETEIDGGGEQAFHDIANAYRRIRAEIERQERRREEQSKRKATNNGGGSQRKIQRKRSKNHQQQKRRASPSSFSNHDDDDEDSITSRATAIGARLKDHRELVKGLFANDNRIIDEECANNRGGVTSLQNAVHSQVQMLSEMNVVPIDAGATNVNEKNETITNSCFYLSLAASYLCGVGAFANDPTLVYNKRSILNGEMEIAALPKKEKQLTKKLALQLKRAIEAAVLLVHPDYASSGMVGEEVQAFSDFLVYALDSDSVLGHWSIAVFDEVSGFVDVYRGRHYGKIYPPTTAITRNGREKLRYKDCDVETKRTNTLTLRYIPGHYQPLLPRRKTRKGGQVYKSGLQKRATLEEIMSLLKKWNVLHVVTDGRA